MEYVLHESESVRPNARKITYTIDAGGCHVCTSHQPRRTGGTLPINRGGKMPMTHYVWKLHFGEEPAVDNGFLLHACGNTRCINPGHLYVGDHADLVREKRVRGRQPRHSKLTDHEVLAIKRNVTETSCELAEQYGVSISTIQNIWNESVFSYLTVDGYDDYQNRRRQRVSTTRRRQLQPAKRRDKE